MPIPYNTEHTIRNDGCNNIIALPVQKTLLPVVLIKRDKALSGLILSVQSSLVRPV